MPSHQERIKEQYKNLCTKCLINPIAFFASDIYMGINRTTLCEECIRIKYQESQRS
jgi:hypothetical protein